MIVEYGSMLPLFIRMEQTTDQPRDLPSADRDLRATYLVRLAVIAAFLAALYFLLPRGVTVVVHNVGKVPLHGVSVHVTGRSYDLGDINPVKRLSVHVVPKGESHLEVSFNTPIERGKRMVAGCYFEKNDYFGTVMVDIDGSAAKPVMVRDNITIVPW